MGAFVWTHQKRMAATYLALGKSEKAVRELVGVGQATFERWKEAPEWQPFIDAICERHAETMEELLTKAERLAAVTLEELLSSGDPQIRFKAAESILNRAGKRGKPVDQMEQRAITMTGDLNQALQKALRDPGVLDRLQGAQIELALPAGSPPKETADVADEGDDYELVPHAEFVPPVAEGRKPLFPVPDLPGVVAEDGGLQPAAPSVRRSDMGVDAR